MNIWFVGRCLSWLHAAHSSSPFHSLWMGILFSFRFLFILWIALRLRFSISITTGLGGDRESRGWQTVYIPLRLSELLTFKCVAFKVMVIQSYLSKCLLIVTVYFNKSEVWVSHSKKWRMNNNLHWDFTLVVSHYPSLHKNRKHLHLANNIQYKPLSDYFIGTVCQVWIHPWWQ